LAPLLSGTQPCGPAALVPGPFFSPIADRPARQPFRPGRNLSIVYRSTLFILGYSSGLKSPRLFFYAAG